jgi:hypothetical protein
LIFRSAQRLLSNFLSRVELAAEEMCGPSRSNRDNLLINRRMRSCEFLCAIQRILGFRRTDALRLYERASVVAP